MPLSDLHLVNCASHVYIFIDEEFIKHQCYLWLAGLPQHASYVDFVEIGVLVCFCALQNHGFDILCSFSAILQHTPRPPLGFSILKAGLKKSVLLSVYNSPSSRDTQCFSSSHGNIRMRIHAC
ncbi:hypothetical protein C4D60_Mb04t16590 [Musa balbisiana]|uniref:Piezo-type mechanosensitive ion channel homolog domain-containing protein n=1 Tax=Musa balbisiana TaxID=52838 RepID=A0A4S8KCG5_MUSBA|nr:hypothetical protein C4D60_Mb04t16590 [Musa balbisiana]